MSAARVLTLVGMPDCHLCHRMRHTLERVAGDFGARIEDVDIRSDADLERRYLLEIPVLLLGRRELARHRVEEAELRRRLEAAFAPRTG
jgi:hypothetical protein